MSLLKALKTVRVASASSTSAYSAASNRGLGHRRSLLFLMAVFFLLWIVAPLLLPEVAYMMYWPTAPLRYLGVFVHEMGHGLASLVSGGSFHWFQMDLGGGVAITSGGAQSLVLLGGLLGPAVFGSLLLIASTRMEKLLLPYLVLILFFGSGTYYMLKPLMLGGANDALLAQWHVSHLLALLLPVSMIAALLFLLRMPDSLQRLVLQLLGIVMCYAAFSDTSYIFRYEALPNGMYSDARVFASLFLPFSAQSIPWLVFVFFALLIACLNFALLALGVTRALKAPGLTSGK
ncbi:M50 family metallopeptidase [Undibacterium sp. TS12]|uniref:M50 family metallopeptidase n=1 Tax=Undibacterium sp. TS12 TaxID=2908202 RepID=UPI001F4C56DF|nr:M50 family metallopeptidase [Undibacterium sp. TS12]MCH8620430.1 M50 family metallopeptidase [Undibacterium sp. TS12]